MLLILRLLDARRETWPLLRSRGASALVPGRPAQVGGDVRLQATAAARAPQRNDQARSAQTASGTRSNLQ